MSATFRTDRRRRIGADRNAYPPPAGIVALNFTPAIAKRVSLP
ncbi:hypothetical protein [Lysobacter capsici]|nr:hypothetical protein [Lysobacter capsici]WND78709.1 hypothetical protein RJ610_15490 [Lysobacter capsici]WND83904.1 hypothetical protein RJ609_15500 [Lysobacter capsici]